MICLPKTKKAAPRGEAAWMSSACVKLISLRRHYPDQVDKGLPESRYLSPQRTPPTSDFFLRYKLSNVKMIDIFIPLLYLEALPF